MHFVEPHAIDTSIVLGVSEKNREVEEGIVFKLKYIFSGHLRRTGNSYEPRNIAPVKTPF